MNLDIQKASMWKRISAWLLDTILLSILAVLLAAFLSGILGYDSHAAALADQYILYEEQYGVSFDLTQEEYDAMSQEDRDTFDQAYEALASDPDTTYSYNMLMHLTIVMASLALLLSYLALEFALPLFFRNGQTLGKKVFGVALMRPDCVKVSPVALFIRTVLGKLTIETMIPLAMLFMMFWGTIGILGPTVLLALGLAQVILLAVTQKRSAIHDLLANTVAVDLGSQLIFDTEEQLIEYKKKYHAEKAAKQVY